ncbi:MAG: hypothetical protein CTR54_06355 [Rhizobium sp.]|nr:MAG: hypothetical protein CTR54_06355 [Rhizobium sp.]
MFPTGAAVEGAADENGRWGSGMMGWGMAGVEGGTDRVPVERKNLMDLANSPVGIQGGVAE